MSSKRKNNGNQEPRQLDNLARCKKCFVSNGIYGQPDIGTILISEIVRLQKDDGPNLDVARVVRCVQCGYVSQLVPYRDGIALGITKENLFSLLRDHKAVPTFTMDELSSGVPYRPRLSPALEAAVAKPARPVFGQDYNPDQHIEPRYTPKAVPQEMF